MGNSEERMLGIREHVGNEIRHLERGTFLYLHSAWICSVLYLQSGVRIGAGRGASGGMAEEEQSLTTIWICRLRLFVMRCRRSMNEGVEGRDAVARIEGGLESRLGRKAQVVWYLRC